MMKSAIRLSLALMLSLTLSAAGLASETNPESQPSSAGQVVVPAAREQRQARELHETSAAEVGEAGPVSGPEQGDRDQQTARPSRGLTPPVLEFEFTDLGIREKK